MTKFRRQIPSDSLPKTVCIIFVLIFFIFFFVEISVEINLLEDEDDRE